ncbi:hypothetical protein HPB51_026492 [Rhipicephalus microplus]|uniref:Uncharacterized protein n=1 Tax=Rhipicephalus microplus TaxID=6941 RepID=A0A9J6D2X8_RHIMP|nr:hypothetical protein HPB51_026492 [Rhipicephalus microplus]
MKTWSAEIHGHVLMSGKRRAGLAKDAVPSIFEGAPRYLSKKIKSPRKQVKRQAHCVAPSTSPSHSASSTEPMPTSPGEISSASGVSAEMPCDSSTVTAAREAYANASRDLSFVELFNSTPGISLPQSSWAVHHTDADGVRDIVFIDAAETHRTSDGSSLVFNRKALHVKSDMTVQAYVFGKQVGTAALGLNPSVSTVSELDTMLSVMNSTSVCCGGPNLKNFPGVTPECAFVNCQGNWRHNRCFSVPPSGTICQFCSGLADTLRIHASRRAARAKQDRPLLRIRLEVAPAQKQKLHALRQAGGQNEHPTFPTFLQLYRMLSLYCLLKPPQFGNCTSTGNKQASVFTLADLRNICSDSSSQHPAKLDQLKEKLDALIEEGSWECDDLFDFGDSDATVVDCIVYYVTGFVSRKVGSCTCCTNCKEALAGKKGTVDVPEADLVNCETKGWLTHPNMHLFDLFKCTEEHFAKHDSDQDVYDKTIDAVLENQNFMFPCSAHKEEMLAKLLHYYVCCACGITAGN